MRHTWKLLSTALALAACTGDAGDEAVAPESEVVVLSTLAFSSVEDGVTVGFDLDGSAAGAVGDVGCGQTDMVDPEGGQGIDNALGNFLPVLDLVGGSAVRDLVQAAVTGGELLILAERVPDDTCPSGEAVAIKRATGLPLLSASGSILDGQTFPLMDGAGASSGCATVDADGVVEAAVGTVPIALNVFDEFISLQMYNVRIRLVPGDNGTYTGFFGGGVETGELQANVATFDGINDSIHDLVDNALNTFADLNGVEACSQVSGALLFSAVPAWIYDPASDGVGPSTSPP
ncbi:MAG: hypothetical protein RLZZ383_587 [Pseudomonadota bacterium]|jgi:hypothetical protein